MTDSEHYSGFALRLRLGSVSLWMYIWHAHHCPFPLGFWKHVVLDITHTVHSGVTTCCVLVIVGCIHWDLIWWPSFFQIRKCMPWKVFPNFFFITENIFTWRAVFCQDHHKRYLCFVILLASWLWNMLWASQILWIMSVFKFSCKYG